MPTLAAIPFSDPTSFVAFLVIVALLFVIIGFLTWLAYSHHQLTKKYYEQHDGLPNPSGKPPTGA